MQGRKVKINNIKKAKILSNLCTFIQKTFLFLQCLNMFDPQEGGEKILGHSSFLSKPGYYITQSAA